MAISLHLWIASNKQILVHIYNFYMRLRVLFHGSFELYITFWKLEFIFILSTLKLFALSQRNSNNSELIYSICATGNQSAKTFRKYVNQKLYSCMQIIYLDLAFWNNISTKLSSTVHLILLIMYFNLQSITDPVIMHRISMCFD